MNSLHPLRLAFAAALLWTPGPGRAFPAPGKPLDYRLQPVTATDPLSQGNWIGSSPQAAVDGLGGGSPRPFAYRAYVRRPWLNHYERTGHQDVGGAGWTAPWSGDCSETGAPTAQWPARLQLDYGSPVAVAKLAVYFPRQGNGDSYLAPTAVAACLESVEVLRSDDGKTWESAVRIARLPWTCPQVIEIPAPRAARHYILSVEAMAPGNDALRIYEVETYLEAGDVVETEPLLPPAVNLEAPVPLGSSAADLELEGLRGRIEALPEGGKLSLLQDGVALEASLRLSPDARESSGPWQLGKGSPAVLFAPCSGGHALIELKREQTGPLLSVRMPAAVQGGARRFLHLRVETPGVLRRFIPAHVNATEPIQSAWPGHWLPTCLAALESRETTLVVAPEDDRCRIGIDGDAITLCVFPDGASARIRIFAVRGDWWQAYRRSVVDLDHFVEPLQIRPAVEAATGILQWLLLEKNWSPGWQMQRSFPSTDKFYEEGEYFFVFYGQPYTIPALWQRYQLAGDSRARERLDHVVRFLVHSPVRVKEGPLAGGYFSTLAGSREKHKLVDQAYNPWMTTQASGAALWSLLYHRARLGDSTAELDSAISGTADCLLRIQRPDGGWAYAHRRTDGSVPSGDFVSSGSIWNVWALHRAGKALRRPELLAAATRGKSWWLRTFFDHHSYQGYWEDSNHRETIYPTREGYECSLAVEAFLEMGDETAALGVAKDLATWVQTRTVSYRNALTSPGLVPEQITWPGNAYAAPQVGLALQTIRRRTGDAFWRPYGAIAKTIGWWCDAESGAMFFPLEAAAHLPLDRGQLTKTYWSDWCGAQTASRTLWWLVDEVNDRSAGRIHVDRDALGGEVLGEGVKAWLPDGGPAVSSRDGHQLNWLGYLGETRHFLAVLNDASGPGAEKLTLRGTPLPGKEASVITITARGEAEGPRRLEERPLEVPAGGLLILGWPRERSP